MYRSINVLKSGGVEICGLKTTLATRRQTFQNPPKLEKYTFVPYITNKVSYFYYYVTFYGQCLY